MLTFIWKTENQKYNHAYLKNWESEMCLRLFEKLRIRNIIMFIRKIENQKYKHAYLKNWESEM
jgi:hypothetical protein